MFLNLLSLTALLLTAPAAAKTTHQAPMAAHPREQVEDTKNVPHLARRVPTQLKRALEPVPLEKLLRNGDWYCSLTDPKGAQTSATIADEAFGDAKLKSEFQARTEKASESIVERLGDLLLEEKGAATGVELLAEIRAAGMIHTEEGLAGLQLLTFNAPKWLPPGSESVLSFFAETVLAHRKGLSDTRIAALRALSTPAAKAQRVSALIALALSPEAHSQELYRQILLTLPPAIMEPLTRWVEERHLEESPATCTALHLDTLLMKNPALEKLTLADAALAPAAVSRLVGDGDRALPELLAGSPALQAHLMPHLFTLAEQADYRLPKILESLSPANRAYFDRVSPHLKVAGGDPESALPEFQKDPEVRQKKSAPPVTYTQVVEALDQTQLECSATGWTSPWRRALDSLLTKPGLRKEFLKYKQASSKKEYADLLAHFKSGKISLPVLEKHLVDFERRFAVTEEAFAARDFLVALMHDETERTLYANAAQRLRHQWNGKPFAEEAKVDFSKLFQLGFDQRAEQGTRYNRLLQTLSPSVVQGYLGFGSLNLPGVGEVSLEGSKEEIEQAIQTNVACRLAVLPAEAHSLASLITSSDAETLALGKATLSQMGFKAIDVVLREIRNPRDASALKAALESFSGIAFMVPERAMEMVPLLKQSDDAVRGQALNALVNMNWGSNNEAARHVLDAMRSDSRLLELGVKKNVSLAYQVAEEQGNEAIPILLRHWSTFARDSMEKIVKNSPTVPKQLKVALDSVDTSIRQAAIQALRLFKPSQVESEEIKKLVLFTKITKLELASDALETLSVLGKHHDQAVTAIVVPELVFNQHLLVRGLEMRNVFAADAVRNLGADALPALLVTIDPIQPEILPNQLLRELVAKSGLPPDLLLSLKSENPFSAQGALAAMRVLGPLGKEATPLILAQYNLRLPQSHMAIESTNREAAIQALGATGGISEKEVLRELQARLEFESVPMQREIFVALGNSNSNFEQVAAILLEQMKEPALRPAYVLPNPFEKLGAKVVPALSRKLTQSGLSITAFRNTLRALRLVGEPAKTALPEVEKLTQFPDEETQVLAQLALVTWGKHQTAVPQLLEYLSVHRGPLNYEAVDVLKMKAKDQGVSEAMMQALEKRGPGYVDAAMILLNSAGEQEQRKALDIVVEDLKSPRHKEASQLLSPVVPTDKALAEVKAIAEEATDPGVKASAEALTALWKVRGFTRENIFEKLDDYLKPSVLDQPLPRP